MLVVAVEGVEERSVYLVAVDGNSVLACNIDNRLQNVLV